jgi:hypothetical protein
MYAPLVIPPALANGERGSRVWVQIREAAQTAALLSICLPVLAFALGYELCGVITERVARRLQGAVVHSARYVP